MKNLGYLGLGVMGYGMTDNLLRKSGCTVYGYDPVEAARDRFAANGGRAVTDAKELYTACDIIFFCLPTNDLVNRSVHEILDTARPGTVIVDMGASSPYLIRTLSGEARERGFQLIDAPVSGGKTGADAGTLAIMCGGDRETFESVKPYLEMMGSTVTYMGASGCGSVAKVANNMMVGIHLSAMSEAFAFAKKAGLDPATLFAAVKNGFAQSAVLDEKLPKILKRDFSATARIAVHYKDMHNAADVAEHLGIEIPMSRIVLQQMDWMNDQGRIDEDQCAMVKYYEEAMGVEVV